MPQYAHSLPGRSKRDWETLPQHEDRVARYCRKFLSRIDESLGDWGEILGRWHDLGKYHPRFQAKLDGNSIRFEHAGAGARLAAERMPKHGIPVQYAIAGHHTGLANQRDNDPAYHPTGRATLLERLQNNEAILDQIKDTVPSKTLDLPTPSLPGWILKATSRQEGCRSLDFFTRILFSALVDADRIATQWFYATAKGETPRQSTLEYESLATLRDRLDSYIDKLCEQSNDSLPINDLRNQVLESCRLAASKRQGIFSLTVPTGGGKTLSAMSFAVNHAIANGLDRVIVVIPYTSIIRQNAKVYRKAFGDGNPDSRNVVEHHSGIDTQEAQKENWQAEKRREIAIENWDAPIIVTTSVQFFESLFSDHPSQCRKLHRIANSVVIFDEIQTLPPHYLSPIVDVLQELSSNYKASIVLSTATPPTLAKHFDQVHEIADDPTELAAHQAARRVVPEWRIAEPVPYAEIATELSREQIDQALVIVHRRKDAKVLAEQLSKTKRVHLSAQMCPAHRVRKIDEIDRRIKAGTPCLAVATQLVEAGVDLDMPLVYRALAGIDSLAQAAGRCDREGRRTQAAGKPAGRLVVFLAETNPVGGTLRKAFDCALELFHEKQLRSECLDIFNPDHCLEFFAKFYAINHPDPKHIQRERADLNFANVASAFNMIEDGWSFPVVVPWPFAGEEEGQGKRRADRYRENPTRETARALQPYIVQIPKKAADELRDNGIIEFVNNDSLALPTDLFDQEWYSDEFGLYFDDDTQVNPEILNC